MDNIHNLKQRHNLDYALQPTILGSVCSFGPSSNIIIQCVVFLAVCSGHSGVPCGRAKKPQPRDLAASSGWTWSRTIGRAPPPITTPIANPITNPYLKVGPRSASLSGEAEAPSAT